MHVTLYEYTCAYTLRWQGQISLRVPRRVALLNDSCALKYKKNTYIQMAPASLHWKLLPHPFVLHQWGRRRNLFRRTIQKCVELPADRLLHLLPLFIFVKMQGVGGMRNLSHWDIKAESEENRVKKKNKKKEKQLNPGPGSWTGFKKIKSRAFEMQMRRQYSSCRI